MTGKEEVGVSISVAGIRVLKYPGNESNAFALFLPCPSRGSSDYGKIAVIKSRKEGDKEANFFSIDL